MRWRALLVAAVLGLWLAAGVAWGGGAAFVFGFFVFVAVVYVLGAVAGGGLVRRAGSWYVERQLRPGGSGRWRQRSPR